MELSIVKVDSKFLRWLKSTNYMDIERCTVKIPPDIVKALYDEVIRLRKMISKIKK